MSFVLMIIVAVTLLDLLWWWQVDRWLRPMPGRTYWRAGWSLFMALQVACLAWMILGRALELTSRPDELLPLWLVSLTFIWHMIVLPVSVVLAAAAMIVASPVTLARWLRRKPAASDAAPAEAPPPPPKKTKSESPPGPSLVRTSRGTRLMPPPAESAGTEPSPPTPRQPMTRRQLLAATAALTPPIVTAISTGVALGQLDYFRVRRLNVALPSLPPALDGLTIAHVADVHVGRFTHGKVLDAIVEQTNALKADLVLLTGDLINHALADLDAGLAMVKQMERKYALAMCEGNHDLFEGRREFERRVKNSGVTLLVNETTTFSIKDTRVQLLGLQWGRGGDSARGPAHRGDDAIAFSMDKLLVQRRDDAFPILLAHHPHAFDIAADVGIPLTLAGHTHGGQLMLTKDIGFGPQMYRYWTGLYEKRDAALVVSNGVGNWFPLRINAPAEIIHITLHAKPASPRV